MIDNKVLGSSWYRENSLLLYISDIMYPNELCDTKSKYSLKHSIVSLSNFNLVYLPFRDSVALCSVDWSLSCLALIILCFSLKEESFNMSLNSYTIIYSVRILNNSL